MSLVAYFRRTAAQTGSDRRLLRFCETLSEDHLAREIVLVQCSPARACPPQLDDFLLASDASVRAADLEALGFNEADTWPA